MNGTSKRIRIKVNCSTCHSQLSTVAKPYDRNLACPECGGNVHIPPYDAVESEFLRRLNEPLNVDPGTYAIDSGRIPSAGAGRLSEPDPVTVVCPICRARLHPEIREEHWFETCPDCFEPVRVPARSEIPAKPAPLVIPNPGSYGLGLVPEIVPLKTEVFERISAIKEVRVDPPPTWTFFSNVWQFPVSRHVWVRYLWMSLGLTLFGMFAALCWSFLSGGGREGIVAAFFALPTIWTFYWSTSYSAACGMTVLEETANGTQSIEDWPEPDWREWMATLINVAFLALVAQAMVVGIELVLGPRLSSWMLSLGLIYALFPIIILSSLAAGSIFYPLTRPVLGAIARFPHYWILYYLLSAGLTAATVTLIVASVQVSLFAAPLWCGAAVAAFVLIQARLLGRLAWRTLVEPDGGRQRKKKMKRVAQMESDRAAGWTSAPREEPPR